MDDTIKYALAALLVLIGSHLLLWAYIKRKIAAVKAEIEKENRSDADSKSSLD